MTLARWKDLCIDAADPPRLATFWGAVLGLRTEVQSGGDAVLRGDRPEQTIWVNGVPEPKTVKNRAHLDLVRPDVAPLLDLGARVLRSDDGRGWSVLADPEGNELCAFARAADPDALVVDSNDPVAVATWWAEVLGATPVPAPDGTPRWLAEVPDLPWQLLKLVAVPEPKTGKNRLHWDVWCDDVDALVARGATLLRRPDDVVSWHVLADPQGNEFCAFATT